MWTHGVSIESPSSWNTKTSRHFRRRLLLSVISEASICISKEYVRTCMTKLNALMPAAQTMTTAEIMTAAETVTAVSS